LVELHGIFDDGVAQKDPAGQLFSIKVPAGHQLDKEQATLVEGVEHTKPNGHILGELDPETQYEPKLHAMTSDDLGQYEPWGHGFLENVPEGHVNAGYASPMYDSMP
jgi:hypothetical protein